MQDNLIIDFLSDKKVLIWGYGREGKSSEKFINTHCHDTEIKIYEGTYDEELFGGYDVILKSPGIPYLGKFDGLSSQTELFIKQFGDRIIGITGTKGKSTTSAMIYHVLQKCGIKSVLVGNIGYPCFDHYDSIDADTVIVYEMSCHQLSTSSVSPHAAILLNLFEDHLDYYKTVENYHRAKRNIYRFQNENDILVTNKDVRVNTRSEVIRCGGNEYTGKMMLIGEHNRYNASVVYSLMQRLSGELSLDMDKVCEGISDFTGLDHRLQFIGTYDGVRYYDDSISTINESAIEAVLSVPDIATILIGGMDRGIDYTPLITFLNAYDKPLNIICMYESGERIFPLLTSKTKYMAKDLKESVETAKKITKKGGACVLSPAAASYTHFKNFEDRGEQFCEFVRNSDVK